jgi:hypothetical protein
MYSNATGCEVLKMYSTQKYKECEDAKKRAQASAYAESLPSQAAFAQASKGDGSWSATQTAGVLLASLAGIAILFVVIKKVGAKKAS